MLSAWCEMRRAKCVVQGDLREGWVVLKREVLRNTKGHEEGLKLHQGVDDFNFIIDSDISNAMVLPYENTLHCFYRSQ